MRGRLLLVLARTETSSAKDTSYTELDSIVSPGLKESIPGNIFLVKFIPCSLSDKRFILSIPATSLKGLYSVLAKMKRVPPLDNNFSFISSKIVFLNPKKLSVTNIK